MERRLRASLVQETQMFCAELLAKGSIDDLLTADYTFVNPDWLNSTV